jgi:hypothetical protein
MRGRCLSWVIRVVLITCHEHRTSAGRLSTSEKCHEETFDIMQN